GLRCSCTICKKITDIKLVKKKWNKLRRIHYLLVVGYLMGELTQFIEQDKIELAREKLKDSALANFKNMLPFIS
ncbi:MAG: hypothetical protein ACRD38_02905, partial [Nitrososphaerales archaeon]